MDRSEWLSARRKGIGASDAAAIMGLSPYKTNVQLWEEKTGRREPEDILSNPFVQYGIAAEPHIRDLFALDFPGYAVSYDQFGMISNNPDLPFAFATLDGDLISKKDNRRGVLEIKTVEIRRKDQWAKWDGRIPDHYFVQVVHQLLATMYDFVTLKARIKHYYGDGTPVITERHYYIDKADAADDMALLAIREKEFWSCVKEDCCPPLLLPEI